MVRLAASLGLIQCVGCYNDYWGGYVFLLFQVL